MKLLVLKWFLFYYVMELREQTSQRRVSSYAEGLGFSLSLQLSSAQHCLLGSWQVLYLPI